MARLYYIAVIQKGPDQNIILAEFSDLSDFNYFRRSGAKEFMRFSCRMMTGRLETGSKVSVREQMYVCHVFVRSDNLAGAAVTDDEYPHTAAHKCLQDLLDDFTHKHRTVASILSLSTSLKKKGQQQQDIIDISNVMEKYKEPPNSDRLTLIKTEVDATKIVLHQTMKAMLRRGENLDDLVSKTDDLSTQAKAFYKTARKTNACCTAL